MAKEVCYVPILKWKQGEQKALEVIPSNLKMRMMPLLEIPPIDWDFDQEAPKKSIDDHLSGVGLSVKTSWNLTKSLFVDLCYIEPSDRLFSGLHPVTFTFDDLRRNGVIAIPVTGTDRDTAYQNEVTQVHIKDKLGVAIRIKESDFDDLQKNIDNLLSILRIEKKYVDLIIDYEYVEPTTRTRTVLFLTGLINSIPYISEWRTLILSGTSMPKDLSDIGRNSIDEIERSEWVIWKKLVTGKQLLRTPEFGDYCIANPAPFEADPRLIRMSANIRYTGDDKFIIFKARDLRKYGHGQYFTLAAQIVAHKEYKGPLFSVGDHYINEVASHTANKPGSPTTWRRAGTNHHLTLVATEVSTFSVP